MRRLGWSLIAYGATGAMACLVWLVAGYRTGVAELPSPSLTLTLVIAHCVALVLTFQTRFESMPIHPLVAVTPKLVRVARITLGTITLGILTGGAFLVSARRAQGFVDPSAVVMLFSGFVLLNMVYVVVHWALRPENVFSSGWASLFRNPRRHLTRVNQANKLKAAADRRAQRSAKQLEP
jgi:hypothetical protein